MPLLQKNIFLFRLLTVVGACLLVAGVYQPAWWEGMVLGAGVMLVGMVGCWRKGGISFQEVFIGAVVARLALLPLSPLLSDDAYRYIWDGLLQWQGINPYLYLPSDAKLLVFQQEWIYSLLNSASYYSVYPPVSQLIFAAGAAFHKQDSLAAYYAIKLVVVCCDLGAVWLLGQMAPPRQVILYAWHPLILLEFAGQAHQEAVMVFFLVLSFWYLRKKRPNLSAAALTLAGWVKLYPFLLLPFLLRRVGWRRLWVVVGGSLVLWLPYAQVEAIVHMFESLRLYVQLFEFNAGPYYALKQLMYWLTGADWSKQLGPFLAGIFLTVWAALNVTDRWVRWRWPHLVVAVLGGYLAFATTVHPWYFAGILAMVPLLQRVAWHWIWLSLWTIGTYLFYIDGPYWVFVWIGWGGWFIGLLLAHHRKILDLLLRWRAGSKWQLVAPYVPAKAASLLDLGAGEGFVGQRAQQEGLQKVCLVDIEARNKTELPYQVYDGDQLPFDTDEFDVTLLVYVLHHSQHPEQVVAEALRVSRQRVVILESVYKNWWDRWVLERLDRLANGWRFWKKGLQEPLDFRTVETWQTVLEKQGVLVEKKRLGRFPHKKAIFVLEPFLLEEDLTRTADHKQESDEQGL